MRLLVTGGMGFIGSNFIRYVLAKDADSSILNLDRLSYGSNPSNLRKVDDGARYRFLKGDIRDYDLVSKTGEDLDAVVNIAAETHVDRSISNPKSFMEANTAGVLNLLEISRVNDLDFLQVSTDEVYGSALDKQAFVEEDRLNPSSPYAATKAAADLLVNAYRTTYGLRTYITRSTNNFGPYQFPEKFIPKSIIRALLGLRVPLYGSGKQLRDWIHVEDHCEALDLILRKGTPGQTYNISSGNLIENLEVVEIILTILGKPNSLIDHVEDRPGHDLRYSLEASKTRKTLGWRPTRNFEQSLRETVIWYQQNESWWRPLINEKILSPTPWKEKW